MDIFYELAELALGSRLKRLSDKMMKEASIIYKTYGIDFEPKWLPVFSVLKSESPLGITTIANRLSVSHPAVSQLVSSMKKKGMIEDVKVESDDRKHMIKLSTRSEQLIVRIGPLWEDIQSAIREAIAESNFDLLVALEEFERTIDKKSLSQRVVDRTNKRHFDKIRIYNFSKEYALEFARLNYEWLERYFTIEEHDIEMLSDPQTYIIDNGGHVLLAGYEGVIVGTVALLTVDDNTYEMAKMAVTEKAQGKQIGKRLMQAAIEKARRAGKKTIVLESSRKLVSAINLYRKTGFEVIPLDPNTPYVRCDIRMKLDLDKVGI